MSGGTYGLCFKLTSFGTLSTKRAAEAIWHFVQGLASVNEGYLETHRAPLLYDSGVRYERDRRDTELQWVDIPAVLAAGVADCKALAAWRVAELRAHGFAATPVITSDDGIMFHVRVRGPKGLEDPSRLLGM